MGWNGARVLPVIDPCIASASQQHIAAAFHTAIDYACSIIVVNPTQHTMTAIKQTDNNLQSRVARSSFLLLMHLSEVQSNSFSRARLNTKAAYYAEPPSIHARVNVDGWSFHPVIYTGWLHPSLPYPLITIGVLLTNCVFILRGSAGISALFLHSEATIQKVSSGSTW